ncbi:hypothetical protein B0H14DRAFT_2669633 [Mycena olivaceomarginata]|nr:hypothetical protein B0H14DRAFT_2669633 [Mycena olivaceomarginata]
MISMRLLISFAVSMILQVASARRWNDTGKGTIIFEEAWSTPALINQTIKNLPFGITSTGIAARLLDIHNERLARMDANGVDYVRTHGAPG